MMIQYRMFEIDDRGRIVGARILDCRDDQDAIEQARKSAVLCGFELWAGARFVGRMQPAQSADLRTSDPAP